MPKQPRHPLRYAGQRRTPARMARHNYYNFYRRQHPSFHDLICLCISLCRILHIAVSLACTLNSILGPPNAIVSTKLIAEQALGDEMSFLPAVHLLHHRLVAAEHPADAREPLLPRLCLRPSGIRVVHHKDCQPAEQSSILRMHQQPPLQQQHAAASRAAPYRVLRDESRHQTRSAFAWPITRQSMGMHQGQG